MKITDVKKGKIYFGENPHTSTTFSMIFQAYDDGVGVSNYVFGYNGDINSVGDTTFSVVNTFNNLEYELRDATQEEIQLFSSLTGIDVGSLVIKSLKHELDDISSDLEQLILKHEKTRIESR